MAVLSLPTLAGLASTVIFAASTLPMLVKAYRSRDLASYSLGNIALANLGNAVHSVYVYSLPPGPIWLLHTFYLVSSALMLGWYLRYGRRKPAHSAARMGGSPDAERAGGCRGKAQPTGSLAESVRQGQITDCQRVSQRTPPAPAKDQPAHRDRYHRGRSSRRHSSWKSRRAWQYTPHPRNQYLHPSSSPRRGCGPGATGDPVASESRRHVRRFSQQDRLCQAPARQTIQIARAAPPA
jgi:hypothetical protein